MMYTKDPKSRVGLAITQLVLKHPFYAGLALRLDPVEDGNVQRIVADGRKLRYNPQWVAEVDGNHLITHVAGCVTRCALAHHVRRGNREKGDWQAASSIIVNGILANSGFSMPPDMRNEPELEILSAEEVYRVIHQDRQGDGDGAEEQEQPESGGDSQQGQGGGDRQDDGPAEDQQGAGGCDDAKDDDGNDIGEDDQPNEANAWAMAAMQSAQIAKAYGQAIPEAIQRLVADLKRPPDDCWSRLRAFVQASCERDDTSWKRPSRRHQGFDVLMPGKRSERLGRIVVAVDTSGSIDERILTTFFGHMEQIGEDYEPEALEVIFGDTSFRGGPVEIERNDVFDLDMLRNASRGGGGTSLDWAFQWVEENAEKDPVCMIFLTDLMAPALQAMPPAFPVLWGCSEPEPAWMTPAFGEVIHLA